MLATAAMVASACGGSDETGSADGEGPVELSIATFTEFGYEELLQEYDAAHPEITISHRKTGQAGPHHQNLITKLGAGSGLADIEAVEEGHLADILDKAGQFHNLEEIGPEGVGPDRWLDWKYEAGKAKDGSLLGYGTDIGPLAMCYRKDMFEAAGLPSDPESVKPLFQTWESYFAAGDDFIANSDVAWFDSAAQNFNAMVNQLEVGYFDRQDNLTVERNPEIKQAWDQVTAAVERGQSAGLTAFSNEWNSGFKQGAFATKTCPAWMLGVIEEQAGAKHKGKWAVTDAFPGGGGNWGGSYLTVPKQSAHPEEAAELAAWLTAPEQQLRAFRAKGTFPSQVQALESTELREHSNEYFGGAEVGALFAEQAKKVPSAQYKGPGDGQIQENVAAPVLQSVEQGTSPDEAWNNFVNGAKRVGR
ncbi:ABC transporter substrate-binding protein [Amycolatopsis aidingensis]|uniref:ABC transporter substrate-binding protein n=1 Tax=Amycolatopsis aidingensis TaxID=2842453 RepID=UPI001C0B3BFD